jgi:hypothetical protein
MARECDHEGFHSGLGKLARDFGAIRFVLVCDDCGEETREVHTERYSPEYDPSGNPGSNAGQQAA